MNNKLMRQKNTMAYNEPPFPIGLKKPKIELPPEKMRNRFGRMVYGHKTAGAIEVMTKECWDNNKKYFGLNFFRKLTFFKL